MMTRGTALALITTIYVFSGNQKAWSQTELPNDPAFLKGYQDYLNIIQGPQAWAHVTDCRSKVIGVIDTGVQTDHPDLQSNLVKNSDGSIGRSYIAHVPTAQDDNGHGTFVSGVIGAIGNNGFGSTGICWKAKIYPLKALDKNGVGTLSAAYLALRDATRMGIKITNNSYGFNEKDGFMPDLLRLAVFEASANGALYIKAAGNSSANLDSMNDMKQKQPKTMIVVAASDIGDLPASFTNFGAKTVDIAAPGVEISSTFLNSAFASGNGTSFSSPMVAAAAAMLWSHSPHLTAEQVKAKILGSADPVQMLQKTTVNGRRLNLSKMLE